MAGYAREPRAYELMAILLPELADEDLTTQIDRVAKYIGDVAGSIKETLTDSPWGRRRLAYTIRHQGTDYRDGMYVIWHFDLEPSRVGELERELKLDTKVIRYLLVHDDPKWGPKNGGNQPQNDGEEEGRGGPGQTRPASMRPGATRPAPTRPVAEAPAEATAPVSTESPSENTGSGGSETPAEAAAPDSSDAAVAVDAPVTDEAPVVAEAPVTDEPPVADDAPVVAEAPVTDDAPVTDVAPVVDEPESASNGTDKTEE